MYIGKILCLRLTMSYAFIDSRFDPLPLLLLQPRCPRRGRLRRQKRCRAPIWRTAASWRPMSFIYWSIYVPRVCIISILFSVCPRWCGFFITWGPTTDVLLLSFHCFSNLIVVYYMHSPRPPISLRAASAPPSAAWFPPRPCAIWRPRAWSASASSRITIYDTMQKYITRLHEFLHFSHHASTPETT